MYEKDRVLKLDKKIYVTQEVYNILRAEKTRLKKIGEPVSIDKIVCNLILEKYEKRKI